MEHVQGSLCFKCHKKGHASAQCKSPRTVYSKVKGKAQVANVNTSKGKEVARIEDKAQEEDRKEDEKVFLAGE